MAEPVVLVEKTEGVAILTLNRPEQLNAMNAQLSAKLREAVARATDDDEVSCIVITGAGTRAFSAGGDIHEQREDDRRYTQAELDARNTVRARGSYEIGACPKPTIGMINGLAYGGAAVLASSLDMRVGCEHASFRFLAAAYGRINSTWTLPNQVGWPIAKELLFTARIVEAEEAYRIGLLNHLVPREQLRAKTMELGRLIAGNNRGAVSGIKRLLLRQMAEDLEGQWREEREFAKNEFANAKAEDAFPEFIARKGRSLS
jgi:enoyl-CoA hydratase/carnithine racemase